MLITPCILTNTSTICFLMKRTTFHLERGNSIFEIKEKLKQKFLLQSIYFILFIDSEDIKVEIKQIYGNMVL